MARVWTTWLSAGVAASAPGGDSGASRCPSWCATRSGGTRGYRCGHPCGSTANPVADDRQAYAQQIVPSSGTTARIRR